MSENLDLVRSIYADWERVSGLELAQMGARGASLLHHRDGKVTSLVNYFDRDRAFADLGLEE